MRSRSSAFILLFMFVLSLSAEEPQRPKRMYDASRLTFAQPKIDGRLDDEVWKSPDGWQGDFIQLTPNEGQAATKKTRFKITYDRDNIYAAIMCYDEPDKVRKIFAPRDQQVGDLCGLAFDSYFNHITAYEFDLTAAGQKTDVMYVGGGNNYDFNWSPNWDGAVATNDSGWVAEFKIPFSQVRYTNKKEQIWGLHVWRIVDRLKEESHWNLLPSTSYPGSHNFGELHGITDIRGSRQTEILPYVSLKYDHNDQNGNPYVKNWSVEPNAGVDAKIGISSNFTLDATINPDFGQIEQDPAVLNLTAYETYFDEKRPFFLEGNDIFDFGGQGYQLFYSRRIGAPPEYSPAIADNQIYEQPENAAILGSAKLTGRTKDGLSVGVLETVTGSEYGAVYTPDSATGSASKDKVLTVPYANYLSTRVKKESADANTELGGSFNSVGREFSGDSLRDNCIYSAHSAGIDFKQMFFDKNYYLNASLMGSYLAGSHKAIALRQESDFHEYQRPDASHLNLDTTKSSLSGEGGFCEIGKQGGVFQFWANGSCWSPGLDFNDIGYLRQTDIIGQQCGVYVYDNNVKGLFSIIRASLYTNNGWTFGKEHIQSDIQSEFWSTLKNLWILDVQAKQTFPSLDTRILRGGPALYQDGNTGGYISLKTDESKRLFGKARASCYFNTSIDYSAAMYGLKLNVNPIDKVNLSADFEFDKNELPFQYFYAVLPSDLNMVGRMNQKTASLTLRAELYINPVMSFQYYANPYFTSVDFSDFRRVADPHSSNVTDRFHALGTDELTFDGPNNTFIVNEPGIASYSFDNPDEFYSVFQSNFVFKWEYKPGSTLYFVWTHNQGKDNFYDSPRLGESSLDLFKTASRDVFMVKVSYWFSL